MVAQVIDVVLVLPLTRQEYGRLVFRAVGIQVAVLARERLGRSDDHVALGLRAKHPGTEGFVGLFKDELVLGDGGSQPVSPDLMPAQRQRILLRIEYRA